MTPLDFEALMAEVFAGLGYAVEQTKRTRDGGIDILAVKNVDDVSLRFLIECKRQVGVSLVRELFGIKHHLGASKAIIATTSDFTKPAVEFAQAHRWELELKNRDGIVQWINSYLTVQTERTV
jgi:restriction system protein